MQLVLGGEVRLAVSGVRIGIVAALPLSRAIRGMGFGVEVTDPVTYAALGILLVAVVGIASWLPPRPAARVDPAVVLRGE